MCKQQFPLDGEPECHICLRKTAHTHDIINGWIAVDFDGTLATQDHSNPYELGEPIWPMVERVKFWISRGYKVKIFTSRMTPSNFQPRDPQLVRQLIEEWCLKYIGTSLPVTNIKEHVVLAIWDDRAVGIIQDTGQPL